MIMYTIFGEQENCSFDLLNLICIVHETINNSHSDHLFGRNLISCRIIQYILKSQFVGIHKVENNQFENCSHI